MNPRDTLEALLADPQVNGRKDPGESIGFANKFLTALEGLIEERVGATSRRVNNIQRVLSSATAMCHELEREMRHVWAELKQRRDPVHSPEAVAKAREEMLAEIDAVLQGSGHWKGGRLDTIKSLLKHRDAWIGKPGASPFGNKDHLVHLPQDERLYPIISACPGCGFLYVALGYGNTLCRVCMRKGNEKALSTRAKHTEELLDRASDRAQRAEKALADVLAATQKALLLLDGIDRMRDSPAAWQALSDLAELIGYKGPWNAASEQCACANVVFHAGACMGKPASGSKFCISCLGNHTGPTGDSTRDGVLEDVAGMFDSDAETAEKSMEEYSDDGMKNQFADRAWASRDWAKKIRALKRGGDDASG